MDGSLFMEWEVISNGRLLFQESINGSSDQPITVTQQIVFRVVNIHWRQLIYKTDVVEACFAGWTEQFTGYTDVSYQQLTPTNN